MKERRLELFLLLAIAVGVWLNLLVNVTPNPAHAKAYQDVNIMAVGGYTISAYPGIPVQLPPRVVVDIGAINSIPFGPLDVNRFSVALPVKVR